MLTGFFPPKKGITLTDCREIRDTKNMKGEKKKGKELLTTLLPKAKCSSWSLLSLNVQTWLLDFCQHCTESWPPSTTSLWSHHDGAQGLRPEASRRWDPDPRPAQRVRCAGHTQHSPPERSAGNHSTRNNQEESHIPVPSSPERSW